MGPFLESVRAAGLPLVWIESTEFSERRLGSPWLDGAALVAWHQKMQGLVRSDVIAVPVGRICAAWTAAHPALAQAALGAVLRHDGLGGHIARVAWNLRAAFAGRSLALRLPAPRLWSDAEPAAADGVRALADFADGLPEGGIDALLIDEGATSEQALEVYRPLLRVCARRGWDAGIRCTGGQPLGAAAGFGFVIAPRIVATVGAGLVLPPSFWSGAPPFPPRPGESFYYVEVPGDAQPSRLLERLAALRGR